MRAAHPVSLSAFTFKKLSRTTIPLLIAGLILSALIFPPGQALSSVRRLLPGFTIPAISPALQDAHTLLYLSFDNTLNGADGETPTTATGTSYQPGVSNSGVSLPGGNQLFYQSAGNIDAKEGTFECWLKPTWNGNDGQNYAILQYGVSGGMLIAKDGANNLRIILNRFGGAGGSEVGVAYNVSAWTAGQWHHLAFVWSNSSKTLKLYIDGTLKSQAGFSISLPAISSSTFQLGADGAGSYLNAVIDEVRISDGERTAEEITANFLKDLTVSSWAFDPATTNIEMYPGWFYWAPLTIRAVTNVGNLSLPPSAATWSGSNPGVAVFDSSGRIKGVSPGTATLTATLAGQSSSISVSILQPALPPVEENIDPYLATPATGYLMKMPVVILRYFPTRDGVNLDAAASGDGSTLAAVKARMERLEKQHKFMLEEGSRFRGYKDPQSPPALGYQVVRIMTVYEDIPPGFPTSSAGVYFPDYQQILARFGAENLVNNLGVKEFWIEHYHHGRIAPNESNMSSPLTGDISNSFRTQGDLPVFQRSYLVYGINFSRSANEATHNHGHQLEAILSHINQLQDGNTTLFWNQFSGTQHPAGRCGNTHFPPNGTADYDYDNPTLVQSDCEDWAPANTGQKKPVNNQTWGSIPYQWPDGIAPDGKTEAQYYIYWMQNLPGRGNVIPHGTNRMSNWWAFTGDWDASIRAGLGLYEPGACAWTISATSQAVAAGGGSGSVNVTCGSGCKWIASSNADWITLNGNPFGAGNGSINFTVAPNPGPGARTGTIAIAGQLFTVAQNAPTPSPAGTITVNTTADTVANDGFCSLREAIIAANTNTASGALPGECAAGQAGQDTIQFSISSGTPSIAVAGSPLPTITEPVQILGNTGGATRIELNGANAGTGAQGLSISAGASLIRNLVINRFDSHGIVLHSQGSNTVEDCYIGTNAAGAVALGNGGHGILMENCSQNVVGGTSDSARNIVSGNGGHGVVSTGTNATGNRLQGNYIGVDATGATALGNQGRGIVIEDAPENKIGGPTAAARNIVSGNFSGITIVGSSATGNRVEGNFIGADVTGTVALSNVHSGVNLDNAPANIIGGTAAGAGNLISGNSVHGVDIGGAGSTGNRVEGNLIGTDKSGLTALPNGREGIRVEGLANENVIGGTVAGARNLISGNNLSGIILGAGATRNRIEGNFIGTNINGAAAVPNKGYGVWLGFVGDAPNNIIGGTAAGARNLISGNQFSGVWINGAGSSGNKVQGNYIGTEVSGAAALPNQAHGIYLDSAPGSIIGGEEAGARNLISGNTGRGIEARSPDNRILGNYIGTNAAGSSALPNGATGILLYFQNNIVGGATAAARNLISGNKTNGITLFGQSATGNLVAGNYIGTNAAGTAAIPNVIGGIDISLGAANNVIGGTEVGARNLISGNETNGEFGRGNGIFFDNAGSGNRVQGNYIGTNRDGSAAIPNKGFGIYSFASSGNLIGGTEVGARNLISGNLFSGVGLQVGSGNRVEGNYIGTNADGTGGIPNGDTGVFVGLDAGNNSIGGLAPGAGNLIAFNRFDGVIVIDFDEAFPSFNVPILSNSIHSNGGLGIDLIPPADADLISVVTPNDGGDADTGPNHLQNFPVLSSAIVAGNQLTITGSLNSEANRTYLLQFFSCAVCDSSGPAEGQTLVGQTTVTTDGSGNAAFSSSFPLVVPDGRIITATATLMNGGSAERQESVNGDTPTDTSEFAAGIAACVAPTISQQPLSRTLQVGAAVSFSVTAAGTGPLTYQWRRDGVNIQGATGSTYSIPVITAPRAGKYDVSVTGACGTVTSAQAMLTVTKAPTTLALTSVPNPSLPGTSVSFTAMVSSAVTALGPPTGTVTFSEGSNVLGTVPLNAGRAVFTTSALTPGAHQLRAEYNGAPNFNGSAGNLIHRVLSPADVLTVSLTDPFACTSEGSVLNVTAQVINPNVVALPFEFRATMPPELVALDGSCKSTSGACAVSPAEVRVSGLIGANQTVTINYRVQVRDDAQAVADFCIASTAGFDTDGNGAFELSFTVNACERIDCPNTDPGVRAATESPLSDQKTGSALIFNFYTSSAINPTIQNTRINLTNTDQARTVSVHLFFVDGSDCSVADSVLCLSQNQTASLLAADIDPGVTGYLIAVAVDGATGCPISFNRLMGDAYIKLPSGHQTNLSAVAVAALSGAPLACDAGSSTAVLDFDGVSYNRIPRALAVDNLGSPLDGNAPLLILNRIGGSLTSGLSRLESVFGILFDDAEHPFSFSFNGGCQFRSVLNNNFPRTTPRPGSVIPVGHTGWMRLWTTEDTGMLGAIINANPQAATNPNAFSHGHNLHALTFTARASLTMPVHPPGCN
jgi:CSLREA domain-containing protein